MFFPRCLGGLGPHCIRVSLLRCHVLREIFLPAVAWTSQAFLITPPLAIVITALTVLTLNFVFVYCLHHQGAGTLPYSWFCP